MRRACDEFESRLVESKELLETCRHDRNYFKAELTKAEAEIKEWKERFDFLLRLKPESIDP